MSIKKAFISKVMHEEMLLYIKNRAVIYADQESFYLKEWVPGRAPNAYVFDFRRMLLDPDGARLFVKAFWDAHEKDFPFQIAAVELGSVPILGALIMEGLNRNKKVNTLIVRSSRKKRWLGNIIEGISNGEKILLMDDLLNSGDTIFKSIAIMQNQGLSVWKAFFILHSQNSYAEEIIEAQYKNIAFEYFFEKSEVLERKSSQSESISISKWSFPVAQIMQLPNPNKTLVVPKSGPLITEEALYVAGEGAKIFKIQRDTLVPSWEFQAIFSQEHQKNILSTPKDLGDSIAIGSYDGNLYILDKETGAEKVHSSPAEWIGSSPDYSKKHNLIYVGIENYGIKKWGIVAIDKNSWETRWIYEFKDFTHSSPLYIEEQNSVIGASNGGNIGCFDAETGEVKWLTSFQDAIKGGMAYLPSKKAVVFGGFDRWFRAISVENGKLIWSFRAQHRIYSTPLVWGDEIFFWSIDKNFYHLNADGELLFQYATGGRIFATPEKFWNSMVIMPSNDMKIYFYDRSIKKMIGYIQHGERITTRPAIFNTEMYITDFMNRVYKFDLSVLSGEM